MGKLSYYDTWQIPDGGPYYAETNLDAHIVEPWNAISSIAIALPAIYWAWRTRGHIKDYPFLWVCIPFLFLNGFGSMLFHAFRSSKFFLWMDVLPAVLLTILVSIYFWQRILKNYYFTALITIGIILSRLLAHYQFQGAWAINVSYGISGTMLFLPIVIYVFRSHFFGFKYISISVICLIVALGFRLIDKQNWFDWSMGTHFLWHVFSGIGGFFLIAYFYKLKTRELKAGFQKQ